MKIVISKLNHEIPSVFHNLKYNSHLTIQELGTFNFKINIKPNGLEKYISYSINHKLVVMDSFQFSSSPLDSLKICAKMILSIWVKNLIVT